MSKALTKKDIKEVLDRGLAQQSVHLEQRFDKKLLLQEARFDKKLDKRLSAQEQRFDKKLDAYQTSLLEAISYGFEEARGERQELRESIRDLAVTLDAFLKRLIDQEDEFRILKAEVSRIKEILKEKLGVEVAL